MELKAQLLALRPHLAASLVGPAAWPQLERLAALPAELADRFGLECRLAGRDGRVDLGIALGAARGAKGLNAVAPALRRQPAWRRLRQFARQWSDPGAGLQTWIPFAFLEFDADRRATAPVPSVFVSFDWPLASLPPGAPTQAELIEFALRHLLPPGQVKAATARVAAVSAELPAASRLIHLGVMLGRRADAVRLSVAIPNQGIVGFLRRMGWDVDTPGFSAGLRRCSAERSHVQIECDVAAHFGRTVGLVMAHNRQMQWHQLFTWLARVHLCTPEKAIAALAWPGIDTVQVGPDRSMVFRRSISHVKLAFTPRRRPQAKVYLDACERQLRFG